MWNRKRPETVAAIVQNAKRHVGYRSLPNRQSAFQLPPYQGKPWNGTFIDRVLHDAFGDFAEVRFISTVTALAYYLKRNRLYRKPQVGDIVFFNFATDPLQPFEQPHVGVVVEVNRTAHSIRTVEGETAPGTPQGSQLVDGVFERTRYNHEVIGYVRPVPIADTVTADQTDTPPVKMSYFSSIPETKRRAVETVQRALNRVRPTFTFNRGKRDGEFRTAFGLYARESGWISNRGELDHAVLQNLVDRTGTFEID